LRARGKSRPAPDARAGARVAWALFLALAPEASGANGGAQREPGRARVRTAQLPAGFGAGSAALADLDGDGGEDLIVSAAQGARDRALFLFRAGKDGELGSGESHALQLDVTAWAAGDVHPAPGSEIVLFTRQGAFVMRPAAAEGERFALLVEAQFLWQLPDEGPAFQWSAGVSDLDGDGLSDLLLPEPDGYRFAYQRRAADGAAASFGSGGRLRLPYEADGGGAYLAAEEGRAGWRGRRSETELSLSHSVSAGVGDDQSLPSMLLSVTERTPAPQLLDWNGDGRRDLLAQSARSLHVWIQGAQGFADEVRRAFPLPVVADRDRRLDASYSSHAVELNGDGRGDCVIFAGDRQGEVRTQALVFVQGAGRGDAAQTPEAPLFGARGRPQDLLVFAGFVVRPDFADVDGDRRPDLVISGVRPDLIDQLRSISSESIDTDLFVYRNLGAAFSRRPDLTLRLSVPIQSFEPTARFLGDVTGDGTSELLLRDRPEAVRLLMVRRERGSQGLSAVERPLFELAVRRDARLAWTAAAGRPVDDLLVLEGAQVRQVRFR
jgi:hypothetical protein